MKEQYTVRIYDVNLANKLEKLFRNNKDIYGTKNPLFVDCLNRGAEAIERDLNGSKKVEDISQLFEEIACTIEKLNSLLKITEKNAKEIIANLSVNQKLLSCNYNMLLGLSENAPKKKDFVDAGMFDDLPERLEVFLEDILKVCLNK